MHPGQDPWLLVDDRQTGGGWGVHRYVYLRTDGDAPGARYVDVYPPAHEYGAEVVGRSRERTVDPAPEIGPSLGPLARLVDEDTGVFVYQREERVDDELVSQVFPRPSGDAVGVVHHGDEATEYRDAQAFRDARRGRLEPVVEERDGGDRSIGW